MTFNGDDRVGLFKNDVLIDIVGDLDGTDIFAQNVTLRRNTNVKAPNTDFSEQGEWTSYPSNTTSDIGNFNGTLSISNNDLLDTFKMYPNPANENYLKIETISDTNVTIFNTLGKVVKRNKITINNNSIDISKLTKGVYIIKLTIDKKSITKKLIRN